VMAFVSVTAKYYRFSWETNFKDRTVYMVKSNIPVDLVRGFFLSNYSEICRVNSQKSFWNKIKFGWRFNGRKK